jgi:hypothetical protein
MEQYSEKEYEKIIKYLEKKDLFSGDGFPKGSQEAKDAMAKARAARGKKRDESPPPVKKTKPKKKEPESEDESLSSESEDDETFPIVQGKEVSDLKKYNQEEYDWFLRLYQSSVKTDNALIKTGLEDEADNVKKILEVYPILNFFPEVKIKSKEEPKEKKDY